MIISPHSVTNIVYKIQCMHVYILMHCNDIFKTFYLINKAIENHHYIYKPRTVALIRTHS